MKVLMSLGSTGGIYFCIVTNYWGLKNHIMYWHDSLVNLLWKSFQHPSSNLCSCYHSVLDHEFIIPELKMASPDLLWYSSDSLHTVGVLDLVSDKTGDHHLSLKADIAFSI
ncbi:hypothetical protein AVEN_88436-1 [Araneus ventricosus]|uniref:Uncharacterized protein n=1 Tax=Araneus ventricosus TaxID=182803 RepID=A0A4Y2LC21_ARAVE|nr:hypothetical protein AVEN_88436-1 [Araneus ventricosus]